MKMILAVMPTNLSDRVSKTLLEESFRVTKFASTAGLLTEGTTTLMIVAEQESVAKALELIRGQIPPAEPADRAHARVTIYVLKVTDFERV